MRSNWITFIPHWNISEMNAPNAKELMVISGMNMFAISPYLSDIFLWCSIVVSRVAMVTTRNTVVARIVPLVLKTFILFTVTFYETSLFNRNSKGLLP